MKPERWHSELFWAASEHSRWWPLRLWMRYEATNSSRTGPLEKRPLPRYPEAAVGAPARADLYAQHTPLPWTKG
jgi:hypothetical protein